MSRSFHSTILLLLLSAFPPLDILLAQAPPGERFLAAKSWTGTVRVTGSGTGEYNCDAHCTLKGSYHFTYNVRLYQDTLLPSEWTGSYHGNGVIDEINEIRYDNMTCRTTFSAAGPLIVPPSFPEHTLISILSVYAEEGFPFSNTYSLSISPSMLEGIKIRHPCGGAPESREDLQALSFFSGFSKMLVNIPLPDTGMVLSGFQHIPADSQSYPGAFGHTPASFHVTWELFPSIEEVELVVTLQGYDDWRPEAFLDEETRGNDITIKARLQNMDGSTPPDRKATEIKFELVEVSRIPGIAMNYPSASKAKTTPDLMFDPEVNGARGFDVDSGVAPNSRATRRGEGLTEAEAVLSSYDWGGYGLLKVTAVLEGGDTIVGYLEGDRTTTLIAIPKRERDSKIADKWKEENEVTRLPDDDDSDSEPEGDKHKGDGLTLYEEYRGFYDNAGHFEGNPKKKDFFIRNDVGESIEAGIGLFEIVSELSVHSELSEEHLGTDRLINFNHGGAIPRLGDQHGVIVKQDSTSRLRVSYAADPNKPWESIVGTPGKILEIRIQQIIPNTEGSVTRQDRLEVSRRGAGTYLHKIVAHELLHACNVYHHGPENDRAANWVIYLPGNQVYPADTTAVRDETAGRWISVLMESGRNLADVNPYHPLFKLVVDGIVRLGNVQIGGWQGPHSGREDCIMRYEFSEAYKPIASLPDYYYVYDEEGGIKLCTSRLGELGGVNFYFRKPQSRYGDAARGECKRQVCVNDQISH